MKQPIENDCLDPLDFILAEHDAHQTMCDLLEEIADSLPDEVNQAKARQASEILKHVLPLHHRIEEEALFPTLMKYADSEDNADEIVARLNDEHVVDEGFAEELIEFLEQLGRGKVLEDANMFGYMLRGFFENYRRHIHWENSVVIPLARRRLSADGLEELTSLMAELRECSAADMGASAQSCHGRCEDCENKS